MFVTFEGTEGSGKSTALAAVADALEAKGFQVLRTREPGDGPLGPGIRALLLDSENVDPLSELFLFVADRAQHVSSVIRPALDAGYVVLCDRYADSTLVYQGYGRGLPVDQIRALNHLATGSLAPDLSLLFDLDPSVGLSRLTSPDRLDSEPIEFHRRVREGFLAEAKRDPGRWRIVDASKIRDAVVAAAIEFVLERLQARENPQN